MNIKKDVVIIGGGASALVCACFCDTKSSVAIIEKADKIGKKILATGNGRCNLTNLNLDSKYYNTKEVEKFFNRFDNNQAIAFFKSLGLETYSDEEGRVYPVSNSANSVLDVLRLKINSLNNVELFCNAIVNRVIKENNQFKIYTNDGNIFESHKLVLALGSNEKIEFLKNLGLEFNPFKRSLVSLKTASKNKGLEGVRVSNIKATLDISGKEYSEFGEILFKNDSVSGIVVFDLSAYMARQNNYNGKIHLDLMPKITTDELIKILKDRKTILKCNQIEDFLTGIFHKAINNSLLEKSNLDLKKDVSNLTDKDLIKLANIIKKYEIIITGCCENNQVFSGGVKLDCLDINLCSKNTKNLYCIGEFVDIDAICGGYNLQWAWTSGKIVGENL